MSLVWHIARKDLFRLRIILLLWAGVLTGRMGFALIQSRLDTAGAIGFVVPTWIFGYLFLPLLAVGMVMGALTDDATCDSDAFWITRPISGGLLLVAKLFVLGLLSLIPAFLTIPWWLMQGYDSGLLAAAFVHTTKWQLIVMILAAPVAALSASNGRMVMHTVLILVVYVALILVHDRFASEKTPVELAASTAVCLRWLFALWVAATAAILFNQFQTRHTRRSLAIAATTLLLAFAVAANASSHAAPPAAAKNLAPPRSPQVLATVAAEMGVHAYRDGRGFSVTGIIPNDPRGFIITVSESMPDFSDPVWTGAKSSPPSFSHEAYFLVHRHDGRSVRGKVAPVGEKLTAATLSYFRHEVTFSAPPDWPQDLALNFPRWAAGADLVKVGADGELTEFPRALATAAPLHP